MRRSDKLHVATSQKRLGERQLAEFNHGDFVREQAGYFLALTRRQDAFDIPSGDNLVLDIGGGHGFFASVLRDNGFERVRVVDSDPLAIKGCEDRGIEAKCGDVLSSEFNERGRYICFNLILHHLVGQRERDNRTLKMSALGKWQGRFSYVFVNEYIYESPLAPGFSGWLIWQVTSSRILSFFARGCSRFIPSLRANTFGVGVRFRSLCEWRRMFVECGLKEVGYIRGQDEKISLPRRLLFISTCRRDYFLLRVAR